MGSRMTGIYCLGMALCLGIAFAGIPEPDVIFHGRVSLGNQAVHANDNVTVIARVDGVPGPVGSYHMGDQSDAGDNYVLRIKLESLADGAPQSSNAAVLGQTIRIFVKQGSSPEVEATSFITRDRGTIRHLDLSDVRIPDTDLDGDSDLRDLALIQNCFTGANGGPVSPSCQAADLSRDGRVDLSDYMRFANRRTGPA